MAPLRERVVGGDVGDNPFVLGPRPLLIGPTQLVEASPGIGPFRGGLASPPSSGPGQPGAPPDAGAPGPAPAPSGARDPERVRVASAQFAGELRAADAAGRLDPLIPPRARERLLIQSRVAQERARGNTEEAESLEALGRELGAFGAGSARARRYEFVRSADGTAVQVHAQDLERGRVVGEQAAAIRYDDAREFFDRLAGADGTRLDPGHSLAATVPTAETE